MASPAPRRFAPPPGFTALCAGMLCVLLGLGGWQVHRLQWKEGLIGQLQARATGAPAPLPADPRDAPPAFSQVFVTGVYDHARELHLVRRSVTGKAGYHILTPLARADGGGTVLVDRGWVPFELKDPVGRAAGQTPGEVTARGILAPPEEASWFTPDNDPARNQWHWVDMPAMARAAGTALPNHHILSSDTAPGGLPRGRQWKLDLPNDHLQYALTWFALAAGLVGVWVAYGLKAGRRATAAAGANSRGG